MINFFLKITKTIRKFVNVEFLMCIFFSRFATLRYLVGSHYAIPDYDSKWSRF